MFGELIFVYDYEFMVLRSCHVISNIGIGVLLFIVSERLSFDKRKSFIIITYIVVSTLAETKKISVIDRIKMLPKR